MIAAYLKDQAARCMSLARVCFDLETARQLRLLAEDLKAKAEELEGKARPHSSSSRTRPTTARECLAALPGALTRRNSAPFWLSACPQGEADPCAPLSLASLWRG